MQAYTARQYSLSAALTYAERGWFVFPCKPRSKEPFTAHGFKDASRDPDQIAAWWQQWPQANVAVATGKERGLVVVDVDPRHRGNISLELLESEHGPLPETLESLTGGGGRHLFFEYPQNSTVKSANGALGAGIDVKADGGYVIMPPSLHPSGKGYEWEVTHGPDDIAIAPLPVWLVTLLTSHRNGRQTSTSESDPIREGQRNETLFRLACAMRARGCTEQTILQALFAENTARCQPPLDKAEIRRIAASACKYEPGSARASAQDNRDRQDGHEAKTQASEVPRPLRRIFPEPQRYPVQALGGLAAVTEKLHATIQAPFALCGQSVLAAAALAVQGYADLIIDGRVIPLSENFLTIGESGERKSAVDKEALRPHRAYEKRLVEQYETARLDYENDLAAYKKAREEALRKAKTRAAKKQALDDIGLPPTAPLLPVVLTEEPTYEGLIKLLLNRYPTVGLFADEGGRMIGGYGMSEDQQLKTAAGLCELWDGKRISRVRGGDGAALLYGRRVSMHLMAQPGVAQHVLSNPLLLDQGFLSRCLTVWPTSTAGSRTYQAINLREDAALKRYEQRIAEILTTSLPLAEGKVNELAPSAAALERYRKIPLDELSRHGRSAVG